MDTPLPDAPGRFAVDAAGVPVLAHVTDRPPAREVARALRHASAAYARAVTARNAARKRLAQAEDRVRDARRLLDTLIADTAGASPSGEETP